MPPCEPHDLYLFTPSIIRKAVEYVCPKSLVVCIAKKYVPLIGICNVEQEDNIEKSILAVRNRHEKIHFLHLWSVGQKCFLSDFEKMVYWPNYRSKCPEVADFCYFGIIPIR